MSKRIIACGVGAAFALALLLPADVSARGLTYAHGGFHRGFHRMFSPYGYQYGYGNGYGYGGGAVATYTPNDSGTPVVVLPAQAEPAVTVIEHHCTMSRETVTVPAEAGGERKVTITRCP